MGEAPEKTHRAALVRAAEILGGVGPLAKRLHVPTAYLAQCMDGVQPLPPGIFLKVVDILVEEPRNPK